MIDQQEDDQLGALLDGLKTDAARYFEKAAEALPAVDEADERWAALRGVERDKYWEKLSEEIQSEAKRLNDRLVSLMGQVARAARNAPLASEADQGDLMTGNKAMRAALLLRRFRSWDTKVLNDEDIVLGTRPAGQSDDEPFTPTEAGQTFSEWTEKISAIVDLLTASPELGPVIGQQVTAEVALYRPGTAFIMMWMDKSQPELTDVSDAVKEVFGNFDVRALRGDDIEHEDLITSRILSEIKTSEFCFADLSGSRPNVYYEVGYAHALPRRVILPTSKGQPRRRCGGRGLALLCSSRQTPQRSGW